MGLICCITTTLSEKSIWYVNVYLFAAGEKDNNLLLQVTPYEREEHVDLVVQLAHDVALLQSSRSAKDNKLGF